MRHAHAAARRPHPWIERIRLHVEPQDLDQRLIDQRRDDMHRGQEARTEVRTMRRDLHAARTAKLDDAQHLADAADLGHARLRDVDCAGLDQRLEAEHAGRVLAGRDRDAVLADFREAMSVLGRKHRLLEPEQIVALE